MSILVDEAPVRLPFLVVKTLSVPIILGWDFQKEYIKSIRPGDQTIIWNTGHETPVLEQYDRNPRPNRQAKERISPAALSLVRPVRLEPQSETKVLVKTQTTGPCLIAGRKDFLAQL